MKIALISMPWSLFNRPSSQLGAPKTYIEQERYREKPLLHRLKGMSGQINLFCATIRSLAEIREQFPVVPEKSILNFFDDLSKKHLLYQENKRFLALAIRAK